MIIRKTYGTATPGIDLHSERALENSFEQTKEVIARLAWRQAKIVQSGGFDDCEIVDGKPIPEGWVRDKRLRLWHDPAIFANETEEFPAWYATIEVNDVVYK